MTTIRTFPSPGPRVKRLLLLFVLAVFSSAPLLRSQSQTQSQPQSQQPAPPPGDQASPDAGGPAGDNGTIALPKKKDVPDETPPPAPPERKVKNPPELNNFSLQIDVPEVNVDVGVLLEKTGQFVPNLKPNNFKVYENGVEQKVVGFKRVEAPITALMLCEFASINYNYIIDMQNAAWAFAQQLRPQDYVGLMTFDLRTHIQLDFTQDKRELLNAIQSLIIPGFTDRNLFDALQESLDRLSRIPGRKYIILIASGRDTFSKITLDKILDRVKNSQDVTIYAISTGGWLRAMTEGGPGFSQQLRDLDYLQADNQMKTFAKMTGGQWYSPRFPGELPDDFAAINQAIRSKYELIYHPSDAKQDGT
ncbi:MAG: VWA domain-containing protein, partial [Terracidiphilus sp.]